MVFQAGFVSLFRTLLVLAAVYLGFRLVFRYLIPLLLARFVKNQQSKFYDQFGGQNQETSNDPEGKVRVKTKSKPSNSKKDLGEYVDYEEVEE